MPCVPERLAGTSKTMTRQSMAREPKLDGTVDAAEVARFDALAESWWDPRGEMRALHMINPVRLAYIRDAACRHFARDQKALDCLQGLRILDIGCGAGILSEIGRAH